MGTEYPEDLKMRAMLMWLINGYTYEEVAKQLGLPRSETICAWAKAGSWAKYRDVCKLSRERIIQATYEITRDEMEKRHQKISQTMQTKGSEKLAALSQDQIKPSEAITMIVEGYKMERTSRGEPAVITSRVTARQVVEHGKKLLEIVTRYVKDPEVLEKIADEFERVDPENPSVDGPETEAASGTTEERTEEDHGDAEGSLE